MLDSTTPTYLHVALLFRDHVRAAGFDVVWLATILLTVHTAASGIGVSVALDFTFTTATLVVVLACDGWSCAQPFNAVSRLMLTEVSGIPIPQMEWSTLSAPEVVVRGDPIAVQ